MYAILRVIRFHITVSQTNGEVGIRSFRRRSVHLAQAAHISLVQQIDITTSLIIVFIQFLRHCVLSGRILDSQVLIDSFQCRISHERIKVLLIRENAGIIQRVNISIVITVIFRLNRFIESGKRICRNALCIKRNQDLSHLAVYLVVIILIVHVGISFFQLFERFLNVFLLILFECSFQVIENQVSSAKLDTRTESLGEISQLFGKRSHPSHILIDFSYYRSIIGIVLFLGKLSEVGFLLCLGFQHTVVDDSFIHSNRIFPIVAGRSKLAGILDTYLITCCHFLAQHFLTCLAHLNARCIGSVHAEFHLALGQIAAGASGKSHNHGIVAFLQSSQRDGKMLLYL